MALTYNEKGQFCHPDNGGIFDEVEISVSPEDPSVVGMTKIRKDNQLIFRIMS